MRLELSLEDRAFQGEVRQFIQENLTPTLRAAEARNGATFCDVDAIAEWHGILHRRGWVAPNWPTEYGGPGWTLVQRYIFARECALAGAPRTFTFGLTMCGPVLMRYGTPKQKAHYLPRILSGEDRWCQGYSEPGAGSDLASLATRAKADGDDFIVDGAKIWTTFAHHANRMFCLVRTDPAAKPQRGISFLLIDLATPGVSMRPIVNIAGDHEFNQVFFDAVRVPKANLVGQENDGWTVAKYLLEFERGTEYAPKAASMLDHARRLAKACEADDEALALRIAQAEIDMHALEMTELRVMSALSVGEPTGAMASVLKLKGSELIQRIDELALDILGGYAAPLQPPGGNETVIGPEEGRVVAARYLYDRAITIYGGTSEVQRNILARAVLGV
jgi:acyl-CoA dehydrogenase